MDKTVPAFVDNPTVKDVLDAIYTEWEAGHTGREEEFNQRASTSGGGGGGSGQKRPRLEIVKAVKAKEEPLQEFPK